ncbi:MAG: hypothetical protein MRY64_02105 [Hyphomonadaceae bacterium]|nr:hypothetical protein [Hyphomonadaceae bacterium]
MTEGDCEPPEFEQLSIGELFERYAVGALEWFFESHPELSPRAPTEFKLDWLEHDDDLFAQIQERRDQKPHEIRALFSAGLIERLAIDIDFSTDQAGLYRYRVTWIIFHELAHWLYGHLGLYKEEGWSAFLGMAEFRHAAAKNTAAPEEPLAHSAELAADSFATRLLYRFIQDIDDEQKDVKSAEDAQLTVSLVYLTTITTASLFYAQSPLGKSTRFHPSWPVRSTNILVHLFNLYLQAEIGPSARPGHTFQSETILHAAENFTKHGLGPAMLQAEHFFSELNLEIDLHQIGESAGMFNPAEFAAVQTGAPTNSEVVRTLRELYRTGDLLIDRIRPHIPVDGLQLNYTYGDHKMSDEQTVHSITLRSQLDADATRAALKNWANANQLTIRQADLSSGPGADELNILLEIVFETINSMGPDGVRALVRMLSEALKRKDK